MLFEILWESWRRNTLAKWSFEAWKSNGTSKLDDNVGIDAFSSCIIVYDILSLSSNERGWERIFFFFVVWVGFSSRNECNGNTVIIRECDDDEPRIFARFGKLPRANETKIDEFVFNENENANAAVLEKNFGSIIGWPSGEYCWMGENLKLDECCCGIGKTNRDAIGDETLSCADWWPDFRLLGVDVVEFDGK